MASITPAQYVVNPSFMEPGIILPYTQVSGAFETLAGGEPLPRLSDGDLWVYAKRMDVRTTVSAGESAYNQIQSASTAINLISTPTYIQRVRAEYDHHDTAAAGRYGYSIVEAQRLAMRQGHYQLARNALLYGFNPAGGEGLLNTVGATAVNLPPDGNGNQTVVTYDNGAMAIFLLSVIFQVKQRMFQLGQPRRVVCLGPQRVLGQFAYVNVVQLTSYQRPGGGTGTTASMLEDIGKMADGDDVVFVYDDTLIGKGAGGTDAVIVCIPEIDVPVSRSRSKLNTNAFIELAPNVDATIVQYCDQAAPREIPTPLPGGAIDVLSEWRISSGWPWRPEALSVVSFPYQ